MWENILTIIQLSFIYRKWYIIGRKDKYLKLFIKKLIIIVDNIIKNTILTHIYFNSFNFIILYWNN